VANRTLYRLMRNDCGDGFFDKHQLNQREVEAFLDPGLDMDGRYRWARRIAVRTLQVHTKGEIPLYHLAVLEAAELAAHHIDEFHRDHVVHSVVVFLLGTVIKHLYLRRQGLQVDAFEWKLASLLHDISYPISIAMTLANHYCTTVNKIHPPGDDTAYAGLRASSRLDVNGFLTYEYRGEEHSVLAHLQDRANQWGLGIDLERSYHDLGFANHGIGSALTVFQIINQMYEHHNPQRQACQTVVQHGRIASDWNDMHFQCEITSACTAIYLHDICHGPDCQLLVGGRFSARTSPLAFLLKLCDALQDWDRPSERAQLGLEGCWYDLEIDADHVKLGVSEDNACLVPNAQGRPPHGRAAELEAEMDMYLERDGLEISVVRI